MSNDIGGIQRHAVSVGTGGGTTAPRRDAGDSHNASVPTDTSAVHITDTAAKLSSLVEALHASPAIDSSRVDAVSQALAEGRYQIDAHKIASGLVQSERGLARLGSKD